ncbi:MAG: UDP-N-acetylglucosamine 2-epimerase [Omnitrophica WOR_2 bacterium]
MINLGVLTSSRADFGIYEPLLQKLIKEDKINTQIIAFGTHLSPRYGYSIQHILKLPVSVIAQFDTAPTDDSPTAIANSMVLTMQSMISVWEKNKFDLLLCLGDRYEMFSAVASTLPFNIKVAHIHGGETTLGAIDNALRHSITHMSSLHFTASEEYKQRVVELTGSSDRVFNTGALSIDNLSTVSFMTKSELWNQFSIDLDKPTMLITLHPETIEYANNEQHIKAALKALEKRKDIQQVITMPNADTSGLMIRRLLADYATGKQNVKLVENFGSRAYLSMMKHSSFMLGNSSSGFIEAAWFPKWVINIGNRQKGRIRTPNIVDVPFDETLIDNAISMVLTNKLPEVEQIYGDGKASERIIKHILDEFSTD